MALLTGQWMSFGKTVIVSAEKFYREMPKKGETWKTDAEAAVTAHPAAAFDLYIRIANCLQRSDLAKVAEDALKKLHVDRAVKDEFGGRQMYAPFKAGMSKITARDKGQVITYCKGIMTHYPNTPTGENVAALLNPPGPLNRH